MRVFHLLQQAHLVLFRTADFEMMQAVGITVSQSAVLFVLKESDGLSFTELSTRLEMSKSSLSTLIDRMIARGLVRREKNRGDGRISNIFIEETGLEIVQETVLSVREINRKLLEPFAPAEQSVIGRFLNHVRQNASSIVKPGTPITTQETNQT